MPKPLFQDNGSGMHVHQSLWKGGEPLFFDEKGYAGLSDMARWYIGGLLKHAPALLAFSNPTTNSYKRLVPGYEAPVNLVYSQRNRSASVRIPLYSKSPKAKRLEFRCPDPSCNPYLAFSAMLMAGLDGIQNRIEPPAPVDHDLYDLPPEELAKVPQVPGSLDEALAALEADHEFLLTGDVFTPDVIETWIDVQARARDRRRCGSARTRGSSTSTTTSTTSRSERRSRPVHGVVIARSRRYETWLRPARPTIPRPAPVEEVVDHEQAHPNCMHRARQRGSPARTRRTRRVRDAARSRLPRRGRGDVDRSQASRSTVRRQRRGNPCTW